MTPGLAGTGPRILHLVPADGIGGVEVAARSMEARPDLRCSFRLHFIMPETANPPRRTLAGLARALKANWRSFHAARAFAPDVILCSLWPSVPLGLALRIALPRARLVYFIHLESVTHRLDAILSAVAIRVADEIWGDSAAALAARGVARGRGQVISFVTDRTPMLAKPYAGPRFVSWGRLQRQKGFDRAIRLIGLLVARGYDVHYDIYGPDRGERELLIALVEELGLRERIHFPGAVARDALAAIAAQYSFFLQPSRSEGMCMAAVEAMQLGLVPIATAVGEMLHYVIPGATGVIVDPEHLDRSVEDIVVLLADLDQWRSRSQAAMGYWQNAPLYPDAVCQAATALLTQHPGSIAPGA